MRIGRCRFGFQWKSEVAPGPRSDPSAERLCTRTKEIDQRWRQSSQNGLTIERLARAVA